VFIHIGAGHVIQSKDIVAIIDRNVIASSPIMEEMMTESEQNGNVTGLAEEAKSFVITTDIIYCSTLSVATLQKRASMISTISRLEDYTDEIESDD